MTTNIVWEDPPDQHGSKSGGMWVDRLAPLQNQPGRWARIDVHPQRDWASSKASALRRGANGMRGKYSGAIKVPPGKWVFRSGRIPDSDPPAFGVWAMYVGPE